MVGEGMIAAVVAGRLLRFAGLNSCRMGSEIRVVVRGHVVAVRLGIKRRGFAVAAAEAVHHMCGYRMAVGGAGSRVATWRLRGW